VEEVTSGTGVGTGAAVAKQAIVVDAESWSAGEVIEWGFARFGERIEMASGFGAEGMALLDIAVRVRPGLRLFTTDTDFFFPETYRLIDKVERRYGIRVERLYPDQTPEQQAAEHGDELWKRNPDLCCHLRKVEPLRRKLATLDAWITAIRREQTKARAGARKVEWDETHGLVKLNPLADWTHEQVWAYIRENDVPYNALHDRGYPSIGCTHCTRAVRAGEDSRAGRWAGMEKTECGIHWRRDGLVEIRG
jgi:phosphoadenosine phosphosulfate reductase